ncbi:MAG TPA: DUF6498-containing protein [Ignavibacteriaceae bacterium]|nr:DUF6498-containing protein [Ignavibacteriaceae bacterium]
MKITAEQLNTVLKDKSSYFIIAMNLFPILGVIFWNWDPVSFVFIYIAETIIIGVINFFKILFSKAKVQDKSGKTVQIPLLGNLFIGLFFLFHYNAFNYGQIELFSSFSGSGSSVEQFINYFFNDDILTIALLIIIISNIASFFFDYVKGKQYEFIPSLIFLFLPYPRIMIQQFVGIFGAFFVMMFNLPIIFLILLQICKTGAELFSHYIINEKFEKLLKSGDTEKLKTLFRRSA